MKYWSGWYDDPNPFRLATAAFFKLCPAFLIAGGVCALGFELVTFVAEFYFYPNNNNNINSDDAARFVFLGALIVFVAGFSTVLFGFFAGLILALFDCSIGKILSPVIFSIGTTAAAVVPISIFGSFAIFLPQSSAIGFFAYCYIPVVIIGAVCGAIFAKQTVLTPYRRDEKWELNIRHLFALTFWIALIFGLGMGNAVFLTAAFFYIVTVTVVAFLHSLWEQRFTRR